MTDQVYENPYLEKKKDNTGLAVASLVLGIVWVFWIGSILAVIFGHMALKKSKDNKGLAIAGLVLGYVGVATLAFWILMFILSIMSSV